MILLFFQSGNRRSSLRIPASVFDTAIQMLQRFGALVVGYERE